jgi:hypothetical protein
MCVVDAAPDAAGDTFTRVVRVELQCGGFARCLK